MQERNQELANKYYARGMVSSEKGEIELAIEDYTEAIALDPKFAEAYYQRGLAYVKNSELDKAIGDYTTAIALNPDFAAAYYNRGLVYRMKEDYKHAIEDYTKAIELEPHNADAYYQRSRAWVYLGEEEKAKADMKTASNIGINSSTALDEILRDYDRAWKTLGNISDI